MVIGKVKSTSFLYILLTTKHGVILFGVFFGRGVEDIGKASPISCSVLALAQLLSWGSTGLHIFLPSLELLVGIHFIIRRAGPLIKAFESQLLSGFRTVN